MRVIVDGYNLIRQSPDLSQLERQGLEAGRRELVRRLSEYQRRKRHQIQVVFDAGSGGDSSQRQEWSQGVSIVYSRRGETADEVIKRLAAAGREGVVIVTADRALASFAERQGATTIGAEEFEQRIMARDLPSAKKDQEEEEDRPHKKKGMARRLPKAARRRQAKLLHL